VTVVIPPAPASLQGAAAVAWGAMARTLVQARPITEADLLTLEAAAKAWGRWRSLEDKLAELAAGNVLGGEITKGKDGTLQVGVMRQAASAAFEQYYGLARGLGVDERSDLAAIDLFGNPERPGRGKKGRPRFSATPRDRNRVRLLLAMGWTPPRIAGAIEVSLPTLHKYFRKELAERDAMRDRLDARRLEIAMDEANKGNVTALRELNRLIEQQEGKLADEQIRNGPVKKPEVPLGKKEQLTIEATKPPPSWGDLLPN
jgi:phage terminase small subunit